MLGLVLALSRGLMFGLLGAVVSGVSDKATPTPLFLTDDGVLLPPSPSKAR